MSVFTVNCNDPDLQKYYDKINYCESKKLLEYIRLKNFCNAHPHLEISPDYSWDKNPGLTKVGTRDVSVNFEDGIVFDDRTGQIYLYFDPNNSDEYLFDEEALKKSFHPNKH